MLIIIHYLATEPFCVSTAHCSQRQTFKKMFYFFHPLSYLFCIFNFAAFLPNEGMNTFPHFAERDFEAKKRKSTLKKSKYDKKFVLT